MSFCKRSWLTQSTGVSTVFVCVPAFLSVPLIASKPGSRHAFFPPLHPLCCRKWFLAEDALKSIGIRLPRHLDVLWYFAASLLCLFSNGCANMWLVFLWTGMESVAPSLDSPWPPCLQKSHSGRMAHVRLPATEQMLKEKLTRYSCASSQCNHADFSFIWLPSCQHLFYSHFFLPNSIFSRMPN